MVNLKNNDHFISGSKSDNGVKPGTTCKNSGCTTVRFFFLFQHRHLNLNSIRECMGINKTCPIILPFVKIQNKNDLLNNN